MLNDRHFTAEEWEDLLAWLLPERSYHSSRGAYDTMLSPYRLAESVLARNNAQPLTKFLNPKIIESLKNFSGDSPVSLRLNLERLIAQRLATQEHHDER